MATFRYTIQEIKGAMVTFRYYCVSIYKNATLMPLKNKYLYHQKQYNSWHNGC